MDPLSDAQKGKASPFLINVGTVNKSLSILRKAEKTLLGKAQDKTLRNDPVGPTCRVLVRNDTGSTLLALSCVEIGDPTISAVNAPFELMRHPMFEADTPTASDVAFAITEEPIPAGQYGRAVVLGVVPCDVNITDTGHGYAAPVSGSTVLTSAASGPAKILWSEGGTGTQKSVVLIDRQGGGDPTAYGLTGTVSTHTVSTLASRTDKPRGDYLAIGTVSLSFAGGSATVHCFIGSWPTGSMPANVSGPTLWRVDGLAGEFITVTVHALINDGELDQGSGSDNVDFGLLLKQTTGSGTAGLGANLSLIKVSGQGA